MKPLRLKNMIAGCLLAAGALPIWGQSGAPTLVIRIDDLGALHSVNEACIQTYRSGIARSVEVMPVAAWYPEAIKMLKENPGLDVGLHLVITSEWENVKWRPLTHCPSLTDENGYFYPMMFPNPAYPGQSIMEQKWDIKEIEQEFRAQIETTLKSIPQLSHLSGHMLSTGFSKEVNELVQRLAKEYNLPSIDRMDSSKDYRFTYIGYDGPKRTAEEKEASFIKALEKLQPGQRYLFLDHPALDNDEMKTVFHIGYEDVALDRQGVTDLLTSPRVRKAIEDKGIKLISINQLTKGLPRAAATPKLDKAMNRYLDAVKKAGQDLHSIMIVQHGNVIAEEWMGEGKEDEPHILNSVSKTFTATAVGLAASEGRLKLTDKVISFFPDKLPATVSENLAAMTVRDLLTMNCGHDTDPTGTVRKKADADWVQEFLAFPVEHKPGTFYTYNSLGTYMLSAIVQKVTGEKVVDYLYPRLFRPLGIVNARWQESPQGINTGGWGLYLKTEDLAKMGQLFLQKGNWNGQQILPEEWVKEASACQVPSLPAGMKPEMLKKAKMSAKTSDWLQGYGYQIWQCRHGAFRADGMYGQFCVVHPATDTILVTNCLTQNMGGVLNAYFDEVLMKYESDAVVDEPEVTERLRQKTANLRYERDLPEDDGSPIPPEYLNLDAPNVWMRLTLDGDMLTMRNTQGQLLVTAGRGKWHTIHRAVHCEPFFTRDKTDTPALGAWGMKDGRLTLKIFEPEMVEEDTLTVEKTEQGVHVQMRITTTGDENVFFDQTIS